MKIEEKWGQVTFAAWRVWDNNKKGMLKSESIKRNNVS
jgi:hypothetical protein